MQKIENLLSLLVIMYFQWNLFVCLAIVADPV